MLSIDVLRNELAAYFSARNITVEVVLGNWREAEHAGADRVILGLGDFDPDAADTPPALRPGVVVQTGATTAAAVVAVRTQEVLLWVHGVAANGTAAESTTVASHARTAELLDATIAGLRRVVGRAALSFGKGSWPAAVTGDVSYGALVRFRCVLAIPVLGDAWTIVPKPYSVQTQVVADMPAGEVVAAQTTTTAPVDP